MQKTIIYEYEEILIGNKTNFSTYFFHHSAETNEKNAMTIFYYAIQYLLEWSPYQVKDYMDMDLIRQLKLDKLLKFLIIPPEIEIETDTFYLAHKLYPTIIRYNKKDLILKVYKNVLDGKLYKFPKGYLSGIEGMFRANLCFQYMVTQYLSFKSIDDMYYFFASDQGGKTLKKYRLNAVCVDVYETPLDYLHDSLPNSQQNEFLYYLLKFQYHNKIQKKKLKRDKLFVI